MLILKFRIIFNHVLLLQQDWRPWQGYVGRNGREMARVILRLLQVYWIQTTGYITEYEWNQDLDRDQERMN